MGRPVWPAKLGATRPQDIAVGAYPIIDACQRMSPEIRVLALEYAYRLICDAHECDPDTPRQVISNMLSDYTTSFHTDDTEMMRAAKAYVEGEYA